MLPTVANDQPAVGAYLRDPGGVYRAHSLQVFTVTGAAISRNIVFYDAALFALFDLPASVVGKLSSQ